MTRFGHALADGAVVAKRNLIKIRRVREVMVWTLMSPIMFALLFVACSGVRSSCPAWTTRNT